VPELPEVEVVRGGLERWVTGRAVRDVQVHHVRAIRRHLPGAQDFVDRLTGATLGAARRRGKYLWIPLSASASAAPGDPAPAKAGGDCVIAHLGMSGQLLVVEPDAPPEKHLRIRLSFADGGRDLRFVDQRTFGGLLLDELEPAPGDPGDTLPRLLGHIARDPIDPQFDDDAWIAAVRRKNSVIKRALLDQTLVSGIGNIYADEALWRARLNGERATAGLSRPALRVLLAAVREVLREALAQGGTSFDSLYVNVNGESGYFDRSLNAYGREGEPCPRCGTPIRRMSFMNRSSFFCPRDQPLPRRAPAARRAASPR
jgi:formamidopyrimidine-DNA glycosylase